MRVPIPVVILLVLTIVSGIWWGNTRHMDFMAVPSEAKLEQIQESIESSLPRRNAIDVAISVPIAEPPPPPPPEEPPKPSIDLGDLTSPPTLHEYQNRADKGADYLIELATALEKKGEFQRCLLAWERVLDSAKPSENQAATATATIKRLRPTLPDWNTKPEAAIQIKLHAGTTKKLTKKLAPILDEAAGVIETASSGIITIDTKVTTTKPTPAANKGSLVTLWLAGPEKKSPTTEISPFTVESTEAIRSELLKTVFLIVRGHLSRATAYRLPNALMEGEDPQEALDFRVTRLSWSAFATSLSPPLNPD